MGQLSPLDQDKMAEVAQICMAHSATSLNALTRQVITVSPPSVRISKIFLWHSVWEV